MTPKKGRRPLRKMTRKVSPEEIAAMQKSPAVLEIIRKERAFSKNVVEIESLRQEKGVEVTARVLTGILIRECERKGLSVPKLLTAVYTYPHVFGVGFLTKYLQRLRDSK